MSQEPIGLLLLSMIDNIPGIQNEYDAARELLRHSTALTDHKIIDYCLQVIHNHKKQQNNQ